MNLKEVACGGIDLLALAEARDRWRALVKEGMNLRVS
jgi:hypothetical protein